MSERPPILLIGLEASTHSIIEDLLKDTQIKILPMDIEQLLEPVDPYPCMIIAGPPKGVSPVELAQSLRMQYQEIPIYLCAVAREGFERKTFVKNGFSDAFLMPMDTTSLRTGISETLAKATNGAIRLFRPVKIVDIEPDKPLGFDTSIYLPANRKYVKLSNNGDTLDSEKIERMKKSKFNSIQVPAEQMPKFYEYSAQRLRSMGSNATMSVTEKKEKLGVAVRDLISGLFSEQSASFESGQAVMKDCGEIVKSFILQGAEAEWFMRIQQILGERGDSYSHSANVSTLAALFSMGLGIGKPEDMALAGLLHDIGIAELPPEIQNLEERQMSPEQLEKFKTHPEIAVAMIKSRKIVVQEIVMKAIQQHHERYNGTGYPKGYYGDRICKEAQVLALADQFDYLTCLKEGRPLITPAQAVEKLRQEQVNDPSKILFNPEILKKLLTLFPG